MAFTVVPTITTGDVATAAWGNTYIKDNWDASAAAVLTTAGDILYASAANTLASLAIGTTGYFLRATASGPEWADPTDGSKLDGDALDIDQSVSSYTPSATTIAGHFDGIDNKFSTLAGRGIIWVQPHAVTGTATLASSTGDYGGASVGDSSSNGGCYFSWAMPSDFTTLHSAIIVFLNPAGSGTIRYNVTTDFAADGENPQTNSDSISSSEQAIVDAKVTTQSIAAALTGLAASDFVGLLFTREGSHANDTLTTVVVLGILLEYGA